MQLALASRREEDTALPDHVVCAGEQAILAAILLPSITLSIWRRHIMSAQRRWLDDLYLDEIDDVRLTAAAHDVHAPLRHALIGAGYDDGPRLAEMVGDIANLARNHADLLDQSQVELRLEVVETDACRKFHCDYGSARLICTYRGPGTLWLDQEAAALLRADGPSSPLRVRQLRTGEVAVFKGRLWAPETAIVHRSPAIEGTNEKRLVLVIDPAGDQSDVRMSRIAQDAARQELNQ